jgi:hypothetical protein
MVSTVESDYTVVFFAADGRHTPGWNWIWKAYRSLGRSYRKNLKSLVCHYISFLSMTAKGSDSISYIRLSSRRVGVLTSSCAFTYQFYLQCYFLWLAHSLGKDILIVLRIPL